MTAVLPCDHGQAQERSRCGALLQTVEAGERWIEDRQCWTRDVLCAIDKREACGITRAPLGLPCEMVEALHEWGHTEPGRVAQQRVTVVEAQGQAQLWRRVRIKLQPATREGATLVHRLTNLPCRGSGKQVADLSRKRWPLETALQHREASVHAAITTLGSPKAALGGLCLALVASH